MHQFSIPYILALASLVSAVPTPTPQDPWEGVIDPWGQYGKLPSNYSKRSSIVTAEDGAVHIAGETFSHRQIRDLIKRESIADYPGKIPGCSAEDDPSNVETPRPGWPVNHGYKIPKDGKDDACTTGHGGDHCWTEYFLVEGAVEYFDWQPASSALSCSAAAQSSCSVTLGNMQQSCSTTGTTSTKGLDWKIIDYSFTGTYNIPALGSVSLNLGGSVTKTDSQTNHDLTQVCRQETTSVTCTWTNTDNQPKELCHQTWFADRVLHVWGQAQRTCNKCTKRDVQQNTGDGKVCVRGQKEFEFRVPINKLLNCDGRCGDNESGLDKPPNGPRGPYIPPVV